MPRDMTAQEKRALDSHITREQWTEEWGTDQPPPLFVVTSVIGAVFSDDASGLTPHEAAFVLVARADTPGDFEWTDHHGVHYRVSVSQQDPSKAGE